MCTQLTKDKVFYSKKTWNVQGKILDFSSPVVMGILNVTPDSFFDGGSYSNEKKVLDRAAQILHEGAGIIDVGGYSTRPGASEVSQDEELSRVVPMIKIISKEFPEAIISIDTFRSEVAKRSVEAGASIVNDVSGGSLDSSMFSVIQQLNVPYILMHMKGTPQTMNQHTTYSNLLSELVGYFQGKILELQNLGIYNIAIDPGFGFAKTKEHNFELLKRLNYLKIVKMPILVGVSRKSMIYKTLNVELEESLNGTTVLNTIALMNGADMLRVHDVKECVQAVKLVKSVYP